MSERQRVEPNMVHAPIQALLAERNEGEARQRELLAENTRLKEQNGRQAETIQAQDVCINAKADRITQLENTIKAAPLKIAPATPVSPACSWGDLCSDPGFVGRMVAADKEKDIAIENAAVRLHWFQEKVAELQVSFRPAPGSTYTFQPKTMTIDVRHPEYITLTF
jgi:hypothetical protein